MNKHEYSAWWRFTLSGLIGAYLCWWLFFADRTVTEEGWEGVRGVVNIFMVIVLVLDAYLKRRRGIAQDERDRAISGIAAQNALVALGIVVLTTPMIISPGELTPDVVTREYGWFTFYAIACVTFAIWVEAAVTVYHHWRDRR